MGAAALSVVGLSNIFGTLSAGFLENLYPKKYLLSTIYLAQTVMATAFIILPMTPLSVLIFSVGLGVFWLASVPLTSGLIRCIYGLRYMAALFRIIFFSHQLGGFMVYGLAGGFTMFREIMNLFGGLPSPLARSALLFICRFGNVP